MRALHAGIILQKRWLIDKDFVHLKEEKWKISWCGLCSVNLASRTLDEEKVKSRE